jgi:hypothetical protein
MNGCECCACRLRRDPPPHILRQLKQDPPPHVDRYAMYIYNLALEGRESFEDLEL